MLIVSNYHYIRTDFKAKYESIFGVTPEQFENQLLELKNHGTFISQEELLKFRNKKFDKNYILVTFDDGLKEQYELARPILKRLKIPFIFFINSSNFTDKKVSLVHKVHLLRSVLSTDEILEVLETNSSQKLNDKELKFAETNYLYDSKKTAILKYILNFKLSFKEQEETIDKVFGRYFDEEKVVKELYMSKEQLIELNEEGSLGSHSHNHFPLGTLNKSIIDIDIKKSQNYFEFELGKKASSISYPYGSFEACEGVEEIAEKHNFKLGFSMERAARENIETNSLLISRYDCNDLPGGKASMFGDNNIFQESEIAKWFK